MLCNYIAAYILYLDAILIDVLQNALRQEKPLLVTSTYLDQSGSELIKKGHFLAYPAELQL